MIKITEEFIKLKLPQRPADANKGTFGRVLIIAGSKKYPGAAILSALSAARIGAGLVTLACDDFVYKIAVTKIPFATFLTLPEVAENILNYDAVLIGPGLLMEGLELKIKDWIIGARDKKIILDAEALNVLAKIENWWETISENIIFTPHPGEMSRLTKLSIKQIQANREKIIKEHSLKWNKTIILKGANTLIANPEGELYQLNLSNPLLAAAGTGDVLSGIISGLLAQGLSLMDASIAGVYIHAKSAQNLKQKYGDTGMTSLDLAEELPITIKILKSRA